jgi:hypothetical protein
MQAKVEWQTAKARAEPALADDAGQEQQEQQQEAQPDFGELTKEEEAEKEALLAEGFGSWNRRDFNAFVKACEVHHPSCPPHNRPRSSATYPCRVCRVCRVCV